VRITRKTSLVALVAAGVVSVSGCGITEAGAAITYTGGQIAEQLVADQAQELADQLEIAVVPEVTQVTVQRLATNVLVDAGAEQLGVSITGAEVDAVLAEAVEEVGSLPDLEQVLGEQGIPAGQIETQAEAQAKVEKMVEQLAPGAEPIVAQEALGEYLIGVSEDIELTVNPRFGQWNPQALSLEPTSDLLSRPADNALSIDELVVGSR
jgi:hypothetical protein